MSVILKGRWYYCASKHAALAVTDAVRIQLKDQGTQVLGVYAGFIDTDMAAGVNAPKIAPRNVAESVMEGLRKGDNYIVAGDEARHFRAKLHSDSASVETDMQKAWDGGVSLFG